MTTQKPNAFTQKKPVFTENERKLMNQWATTRDTTKKPLHFYSKAGAK